MGSGATDKLNLWLSIEPIFSTLFSLAVIDRFGYSLALLTIAFSTLIWAMAGTTLLGVVHVLAAKLER